MDSKRKAMINSTDDTADYRDYQLKKHRRHITYVILLVIIVNFIMIIPDLEMTNHTAFLISLRVIYNILIAASIPYLRKTDSYPLFSIVIAIHEVTAILIFLIVMSSYKTPNILIQSMGLVVIETIILLLPNYWIHRLIAAWFAFFSFFGTVVFILGITDAQTVPPAFVFSFILTIILTFSSWNYERYHLLEFRTKIQLEKLSFTDHLTQVSNRAYFYKMAQTWIEICTQNNFPLSLIFIDVNDMKKLNDTYGHQIGDKVLQQVSEKIKQRIRHFDVFARWGGDEFLILLPETDEKNAQQLADELKTLLQNQVCLSTSSLPLGSHPIYCSFGITEMMPEDTIDSLIQRADALMYEEKKQYKKQPTPAEYLDIEKGTLNHYANNP